MQPGSDGSTERTARGGGGILERKVPAAAERSSSPLKTGRKKPGEGDLRARGGASHGYRGCAGAEPVQCALVSSSLQHCAVGAGGAGGAGGSQQCLQSPGLPPVQVVPVRGAVAWQWGGCRGERPVQRGALMGFSGELEGEGDTRSPCLEHRGGGGAS